MSRAEWWAWWAGWWAVGFTVLAALAGLIAWYWGNRAAAEHDERTQSLEFKIAEQQERAAKAEKDLEEIKERGRPRVLDEAAKDAIRRVLLDGVPVEPVRLIYIGGSTNEPGPLAYSLADVLRKAGWNIVGPTGGPWTGTPPTGILIRVAEIGDVPKRAGALEAALTAGGLTPRTIRATPIKPGEVELVVGLKP